MTVLPDSPEVPKKEATGRPINFRPTKTDRANIEAIRAAMKWIAADADAIRFGLAAGVEKVKKR